MLLEGGVDCGCVALILRPPEIKKKKKKKNHIRAREHSGCETHTHFQSIIMLGFKEPQYTNHDIQRDIIQQDSGWCGYCEVEVSAQKGYVRLE